MLRGRLLAIVAVTGVLLMASAATTGTAEAARGGADRPMRCAGTGNFHMGVRNRFLGFTDEGVCTHLGAMTDVGHGAYPQFPDTGPGTFDVVFTAANGDQIFGTGVITAIHAGDFVPDLTFRMTTQMTFTGGTGRFSAARGSMTETETGVFKPECEGPVCDSWDTTFTDVGTISY